MNNRRSLITGLISFVAAPAIVRVSSIMPVKVMLPEGSAYFDFDKIDWGLSQLKRYEIWCNLDGSIQTREVTDEEFYK